MKTSFRLLLAIGLVAVSTTAGLFLASGTLPTNNPTARSLGAQFDLIALVGIAYPPSPSDTYGGAIYTSVTLRSEQLYTFSFVFNPAGTLFKATEARLSVLSQDCPGCPLSLAFSYAINGVGASGTMQFPGRSLQGPVTNEVTAEDNSTAAIKSGLNVITLQLNLETFSTGPTANFIIGIYRVSLFVGYLSIV